MAGGPGADPVGDGGAPVDVDLLDRLGRRLASSVRFETVDFRPPYAPEALHAAYDLGYFPPDVERATLRIQWFENDDFSVHYSERHAGGVVWACRWDRHPNEHNTREHVHPPPDAATPGRDADHPDDWRDVIKAVLDELDRHIESVWD